jgi:hypothetical protein
MGLDLDKLRKFIFEASRATYASGSDSIKEKQSDKSTTMKYESGPFSFHDNYFGGEPYGGREVVFFNGKPVWMMVYFGSVHRGTEAKEVYPFLIESLSNSTLDMPYRGPESYVSGLFKYENVFEGELGLFSGIERIFKDGVCVYEASYTGGLVDQ